MPVRSVDFTNGKIQAVLGRTILFRPEGTTRLIAYKFRRKGESFNEFCREKDITEIYRQTPKFKSELPRPVELLIPAGLPTELFSVEMDTEQPGVYVQEVEDSYYNYLHQIRDDREWKNARLKFLHDSGLQIANGQLPPYAELYHNQETVRKYQPLSNLIPNINRGAGRLEAPYQKTRYPNAGQGGTRDVGDGPHLSEAVNNPTLEAYDLFKMKSGKTHYMLMNAIAKLMLVDSLLLIQRLDLQARINWEDQSTVDFVAESLKEGYVEILAGFTGKDRAGCSAFLGGLPLSFEKQARQLLFWAQTDDRGYPKYLKSGELPASLYDEGMKYLIDLKQADNYSSDGKFINKGEKDFGCYNGPLGWVEHEKGWYWISTFAVSLYLHENAMIDSAKIGEHEASRNRPRKHRTLFSKGV